MRSNLIEANNVIRGNIHFYCLIRIKPEEQQSSVVAEGIVLTLSVDKRSSCESGKFKPADMKGEREGLLAA